MGSARFIGLAALAAPLCLAGCGTYVPSLTEVQTPAAEQDLVRAVVTSIKCDISNAVIRFIDSDRNVRSRNLGRRSGEWLDHWGAQVALTLVVEERSVLSPSAVGMPPGPASALFTIGGAATASADATRTDKANYFFTVKELYQRGGCRSGLQPQIASPSPLIQNDLGIRDWLFDQLLPAGLGDVSFSDAAVGSFKQNVLSHEVKFEVVTSGSLTPAWKLVRATVNPSGALLTASRDRTSDLIVTFGPLDAAQKTGQLAPQAEYSHLISQLGVANSTNAGSGARFSIFP